MIACGNVILRCKIIGASWMLRPTGFTVYQNDKLQFEVWSGCGGRAFVKMGRTGNITEKIGMTEGRDGKNIGIISKN